MTVKEYLSQAYRLDQRIKSNIRQKENLEQMRFGIASPGFEEHFNASKNTDAPFVKTLEKIMEFEILIEEETELLVQLQKQIWTVILKVDNPDERVVLQERYIHNCSWPKIADMLNADETTVRRWHNKALAKISLPENPIVLKDARVCT